MFWINELIETLAENRFSIKDEDYDLNPNIQAYFANTKHTTKPVDVEDKSTVFNILERVGLYSMTQNEELNSARTKDALYNLPKVIAKIRNPPLPAIENVEDSHKEVSDDLEGEDNEKIIIPSNIIDI